MTEDISGHIHMAITVNLLAALVATVLVILAVMLSVFRDFATKIITTSHEPESIIVTEIANQKWVSAAVAYKFVEYLEGRVTSLSITLYEYGNPDDIHEITDTITSSDKEVLLKNSHKNVEINASMDSQGYYTITIAEVAR